MADAPTGAQTPFYAGWMIVGFTFVVQFVAVGLCYYAFGAYLKPLAEALDADRFAIALTLSIQSIVVAVLSPIAGRMLSQYSIRLVMFIGVASLAIGFLLLSQITAVWQLYILFGGVVAIGMVALGTIPCNTLLANWFEKRRGTAMGISQFGITISATVIVPGVTWVIYNYDWQTSFIVCGLAAVVILVPTIWRFAIMTPEEVGLHPDGAPTPSATAAEVAEQWSFARALKTRDIWLVTLIIGPCFMGIASVVLALPSHAIDLGLEPVQGASIVAFTTLLGAIAKPLFGTLADHVPKRAAVALAVALQAAGVATLISVDSYLGLVVAGCLFGLGYGGIAPLWSVMLATQFGRASFAQVMGANMPLLMPFNILGLPLTAWVFETTGSYIPAFTGLLGGYVVVAIALATFRLRPYTPPTLEAQPAGG